MSWSRFDDLYDDHPKLMAAMHECPLAAALHAQAITAASRRESDGLVDPFWLLARVPDKRKRDEALAVLERLRLYDALPAGETVTRCDKQDFEATVGPFSVPRHVVHDYLDFNPSSTQLAERRRKDAERKAKGRKPDSAGNPSGVRAEPAGSPGGPSRARPAAHPIPSQSLLPPQPPERARGGQDQPAAAGAGELPANSRAHGTNPRALARAAKAGEADERATRAATALVSPGDEHIEAWDRVRQQIKAACNDTSWGIHLSSVGLVGVAGTKLVIDAPDDVWAWVTSRFATLIERCAEAQGVPLRLATKDEHAGLLSGVAA